MYKLLSLSLACSVLMVSSAFADHHGKKFKHMDTNEDGVVTEEEFVAKAKKRFATMDQDKDGKLTKQELRKAKAKKRDRLRDRKASKEEREENSAEQDAE